MPLTRRYRTGLLSQELFQLRNRFYTDTFPPKANSVSENTCFHIFTDGEIFIWIMPLFSKAEVGMAHRAFKRQVGITNELHFDRASEQMGPHSNLQCDIREFRIEWRNPEPCSPWQNRADNMIGTIKGKWKRRTVLWRIPKNCWSFRLVWESEIYSRTLYKCGTTWTKCITGDTIDISEWNDFGYYYLCQYWDNKESEYNPDI